MSQPPSIRTPRIIRQMGVIRDLDWSPEAEAKLVAAVEAQAFTYADALGIEPDDVDLKGYWDLAVTCGFTDYPMYLLGPGAPRIQTALDVFCHYHVARYTVVIRSK